jgi:hypothetical protein
MRAPIVLAALASAAVAAGLWWSYAGSAPDPDGLVADLADEAPVRGPHIMPASATWLSDDAEVIGVAANRRHRAYLVRALHPAGRHVINDALGGVPVTVCYCVRTDGALVLTAAGPAEPLDVAFGGYLGKFDFGTLLLRVGPWHYRMDDCLRWEDGAPPLPYARTAHERATWKAWREAHPDTDVHVGEPQALPSGQSTSQSERQEARATSPRAVPAGESRLGDESDVIGVSVGRRHRAYPVRAFQQGTRHVLRDNVAGFPVAVTFCGIAQCSQAFMGSRGDAPLDVNVSGFEGQYDWGGMVLRVGRWHYAHGTGLPMDRGAPAFPYGRPDFERTTWKKWRERHPDTDVYIDEISGAPADIAQ